MRHFFRLSLCQLSIVLLTSVSTIGLSSSPSQALTWDFWNQLFKSPPPVPVNRGGSRSPYLCQITPDRNGKVLGDRPTLVWKGSVQRIELVNSEKDILWAKNMTTVAPLPSRIVDLGHEANRVTADVSLDPGQTYQWRIYQIYYANPSEDKFFTIPFQTLSIQERQELDLPKNELVIMERATALAKAKLWSDFWYEVLSIEAPTAEVTRMIDNTFAQLCPFIETAQHLKAKDSPLAALPHQDYAFEGQPGQIVDIAVESNDFQPQFEVLSLQGTALPQRSVTGDRRIPSAESPATRFHAMALVTLPDRGTYKIRVKSVNGDVGQYGLKAVWRW